MFGKCTLSHRGQLTYYIMTCSTFFFAESFKCVYIVLFPYILMQVKTCQDMRTIQYIYLYTIKSLLLILQNFTKEEKRKKERKSGKIVAKADFCCQRGTLDSAKGKRKNKTLPCIKLPGCPHLT